MHETKATTQVKVESAQMRPTNSTKGLGTALNFENRYCNEESAQMRLYIAHKSTGLDFNTNLDIVNHVKLKVRTTFF